MMGAATVAHSARVEATIPPQGPEPARERDRPNCYGREGRCPKRGQETSEKAWARWRPQRGKGANEEALPERKVGYRSKSGPSSLAGVELFGFDSASNRCRFSSSISPFVTARIFAKACSRGFRKRNRKFLSVPSRLSICPRFSESSLRCV